METEIEYLEETTLTDDLVLGWILQSRLAAPVVRRTIDGVITDVPCEYYARVRQRVGKKERTIAEVGEAWKSSDYAELSDDELLPAAPPLRQTLRLGLLETPSTGACRVEFARTKGGSKFFATPWFEGWGEALVLDDPAVPARGGRTPEHIKADASANLSASLSSTAQVLTRVNAHITAHAVEAAKQQGVAIGRAESLLPLIEHLQARAEQAEEKLSGESAWKAVSDSVSSVVGVVNTFAARPDLPQMMMMGHQMLAELNRATELRRAEAEAKSRPPAAPPPPNQKPTVDRQWVRELLQRVVADRIVTVAELRAIVAELPADPATA